MISTTKFIDTCVFIERWTDSRVAEFINNINSEKHCTSVLVLAEVYHKLEKKGMTNAFKYIRAIMGTIKIYDVEQNDLFNAMKNPAQMNINDKIHTEVMKRNNINTIVSFDKDFDRDKTIMRESI